ncbi:MAG: chlorite dismutase family protein [Chloroflexi bacterium]|nr:chlorite dismutase family protein [Chloroflexota bacterium]
MAGVSDFRFVQYLALKTDSAWRRLPEEERRRGRAELTQELESGDGIKSYAYSTLGLKTGADLFLWRMSDGPDRLQESLGRLLLTGLGKYLQVTHSLIGLIRPSTYVRRQDSQEQAIFEQERQRYLIVYPFSKTTEWYLMSKDARQGMMNEHMRIGHEFPKVRQLLVYSTGLDDQEFIVSYETEDLDAFQQLVIALRDTEARRFTLRDTPIFTCVYRSVPETLALLG